MADDTTFSDFFSSKPLRDTRNREAVNHWKSIQLKTEKIGFDLFQTLHQIKTEKIGFDLFQTLHQRLDGQTVSKTEKIGLRNCQTLLQRLDGQKISYQWLTGLMRMHRRRSKYFWQL